MRTLKFRYWNTITKEMVNNPKMPYKENWTIEQLFEDRGWVWMQFTGLTDRHGVEIYEGDLLQHYSAGYHIGVFAVKWNDNGFWDYGLSTEDSEVIGNIYENPELLEVGE